MTEYCIVSSKTGVFYNVEKWVELILKDLKKYDILVKWSIAPTYDPRVQRPESPSPDIVTEYYIVIRDGRLYKVIDFYDTGKWVK